MIQDDSRWAPWSTWPWLNAQEKKAMECPGASGFLTKLLGTNPGSSPQPHLKWPEHDEHDTGEWNSSTPPSFPVTHGLEDVGRCWKMLEGYGTKKSAIEAQCARKTPHWHLDLPGRWIKNGELSDGGKCTDCTGRFSMSRHLQWYMMIYVWYSDICIIYICMYMAILCTLSILATAHHLVKRCTQLTLRKDHVSDCCLDNIPVWLPRVISTEEHPKGEEILTIPEMVACIFLLVWGKNCPLRRFKRSLNKCC